MKGNINQVSSMYSNKFVVNDDAQWFSPEFVSILEKSESIEIIYKQKTKISSFSDRLFKVIYSCVDGKWNKSERIYGKIIPASKEYYSFD